MAIHKNFILSSIIFSLFFLTGTNAFANDTYSQEYSQSSTEDNIEQSKVEPSLEQLIYLAESFSLKFLAVSDDLTSTNLQDFDEIYFLFEEFKNESNRVISDLDHFDQEDTVGLEQYNKIKNICLDILGNITLQLAKQAIECNHSLNNKIREKFELIANNSNGTRPADLLQMQILLKLSKQYNSMVKHVSQGLQELTLNLKSS